MKQLFHLLLFNFIAAILSAATFPVKQQTFLQFTDPSGKAIRGSSTSRGYENQIIATSFSGVTTGNQQVQFTMPSGAASATLASLQTGKQKLSRALFTITVMGESGLNVINTVHLEDIRILSVHDANGSTTVSLSASRIGTTYYQYDRKKGTRTISGKTGFDYTTKQPWNGF